ncbi:MAG TPA: SUF system NifU family Fe-S cluster assembly protein [Dehalococcoidia bacterium]|jgi:nitrogen fixation NifU-like protein|nr:SUF system NifU family Fe-S cluster assembly protein [Chloroflexota bacterium]MDP6056603.1 SUF system NifU family Fe-S cluster assembly protein [Dehalococcoidia bacterium]MDP7262634.1 SUF system NifU family Fe-S cluster assembly protein [Dehalococcoidia bacterium]MDP7485993.1 SUF system NifU family Fe-S cluster assembly protein [Dehalococcoidia bacterium]HJP28007.1 SUF system NifU family Fe-S cluster assembly protein [Dehalococcoidia bacterium]|tara:strand:+ start:5171 stop:5632 length:462 start_codon:yes stop_codon:yes gene_type:complete
MPGGMSGLGDMDELYEAIILDHYRSPRNTAAVDEPDIDLEVNNPFCGDEFHIQLKIENDAVSAIGITGRGCAISQASASLLAELVEGKSSTEVQAAVDAVRRLLKGEEITDEETDILGDIEALGGVRKFPVRIKCALLSWVGLGDALKEHLDG